MDHSISDALLNLFIATGYAGIIIVGLPWRRRAVARAAGVRAHRNEAASFDRAVQRLSDGAPASRKRDPIAFVASFKGVFIEGMEAAVVVITWGATAHQLPVALVSAGAAVGSVGCLGAILHRPLTCVPENALELAVGLLLSSFGTFCIVEGLGREWPGADLAIIVIGGVYTALTFGVIRLLAHAHSPVPAGSPSP